MTKLSRMKRLNRTTWTALALTILMAAGTFNDAQAQTRVRGGIKVDCPKEKTKKTTLKGGQTEAKFRITVGCRCGFKDNDLAGTKKSAANAFAELAAYMNTGKGDKRVAEMVKAWLDTTPREPKDDIPHSKRLYTTMDVWFRKHGLYSPTTVKVAPPPGGSQSKTHYCYNDLDDKAAKMIRGEDY